MTARNHDDYKDNIGAYVLGALPELEAEVLEKHLAGCESCRAEVDELRPVTAAMARSVPQVEPPPSLKASLMATVDAESELRAGAELRSARRRGVFGGWLASLKPRMAAATALAVLALGVVIGVTADQFAGGGERTVSAQINRMLMPTGDARLRLSEDRGDARVILSDAPSPGSGRLYELWVKRGDRVEPGPVVTAGGDGSVRLPEGLAGADAVMVTLEEKRVTKPTGPVIMTFDL